MGALTCLFMDSRGVSPVVGVILMVALTIVLASMFAVSLFGIGDFDLAREQSDDLLDGEDPVAGDSSTTASPWTGALVPTADPGDEPATGGESNDDVLMFRVENTRDENVTVERFAVDATGVGDGIDIDNTNEREFDIQRGTQEGKANKDADFAADGEWYHVVGDSDEGQVAEIEPDLDYAELDIREFSEEIGELEFTESASDADVTVELGLSDDTTSAFYFAVS